MSAKILRAPSALDGKEVRSGPAQEEWARALPDLKRVGRQLQGACPLCGGTDRFYVRDNGRAYCRRCLPDGSDPERYKELLDTVFLGPGRSDRRHPSSPNAPTAAVSKPKLPQTFAGWQQALELLGIAYRYNKRSQRPEVRLFGDDWMLVDDLNEARIQVEIEGAFNNLSKRPGDHPWRVGPQRWKTFRDAELDRHRVDPFITNYLASLPPAKESSLLDRWLFEMYEWDSPEQLVRWVGRYLFLAPIQRAYEPGCKIDETPVLVGPQGCGKSDLGSHIVPPEMQSAWFTDALDLNADEKTLAEATLGRVICEIPEMAGANRRDISKIKAWLTRLDDGAIRLAYARHPVATPRRFIAVGTANGECLPNDESGNRRWVVIETRDTLAKMMPKAYLKLHRDQLFAEALADYRDAESANLTPDLTQTQRHLNLQYRKRDISVDDHVAEFLEDREAPVKLQEVIDHTQKNTKGNVNRNDVITAMRAVHWDRSRTRKARLWERQR